MLQEGPVGEDLDKTDLPGIDIGAAAGRVDGFDAGPAEQDGLHLVQDIDIGAEHLAGIQARHLGDQLLQLGILRHGGAQIGQLAIAAQLRQAIAVGVEGQVAAGAAVDVVIGEPDIRDLAGAAIGAGIGRDMGDPVAGDLFGAGGRGQVDRAHAGIVEVLQLARVGIAVLVQIAPDQQVGKGVVLAVDHAIGIGIEHREAGKAVHGFGAEQFGMVVDLAVLVAVDCQQPVIGANPAGQFADAIGVDIPIDRTFAVDRGQFQPVAVQIQHQRRGFGAGGGAAVFHIVGIGVVALVVAIQPVVEVVPQRADLVLEVFALLRQLVQLVLGPVAQVAGLVAEFVLQLVIGVFHPLAALVEFLLAEIDDVVALVLQPVERVIGQLTGLGLHLLPLVADRIAELGALVLDPVGDLADLVGLFADPILDPVDAFVGPVLELVAAVAQPVQRGVLGLVDRVLDLVDLVLGPLGALIPFLGDAVPALFQGLFGHVEAALAQIGDVIGQVIGPVAGIRVFLLAPFLQVGDLVGHPVDALVNDAADDIGDQPLGFGKFLFQIRQLQHVFRQFHPLFGAQPLGTVPQDVAQGAGHLGQRFRVHLGGGVLVVIRAAVLGAVQHLVVEGIGRMGGQDAVIALAEAADIIGVADMAAAQTGHAVFLVIEIGGLHPGDPRGVKAAGQVLVDAVDRAQAVQRDQVHGVAPPGIIAGGLISGILRQRAAQAVAGKGDFGAVFPVVLQVAFDIRLGLLPLAPAQVADIVLPVFAVAGPAKGDDDVAGARVAQRIGGQPVAGGAEHLVDLVTVQRTVAGVFDGRADLEILVGNLRGVAS